MFVRKHFALFTPTENKNLRNTYKLSHTSRSNLSAFYHKSIYYMSVTVYNAIPNEFKDLNDLQFKKRLINWLFSKLYYSVNEFLAERTIIRCKQWVKNTGNEDLAYVPIQKLNQLKYVCGKHFEEKDFNKKKNRLKPRAVPSLRLSAKPLSDDILQEFPCHLAPKEPNIMEVDYDTGDRSDNLGSNQSATRIATAHDHTYDGSGKHTDDSRVNVDQDSPIPEQDGDCDVAAAESGVAVESPCPSPEVVEEPEEQATVLPVTCDQCHQVVQGHRWVCVSCSGLVLCGSCVSHGVHPTCYVLRVPPLRPQWEVQAVLRAVRQALAMSSFADRLAEPLCDYEIAQDLSDEIKVESEDELQAEDEVTETVTADTLLAVGPDPLAPATPTKKISSARATKDRSKACDLQSETESHTDAISHQGSDSDRDHVIESADDDSDATETEAGASKVDTNTNVTGNLSLHLRGPHSLKCDKDQFAKPTTNRMYVKRVKLSDVEHVKLSDVKRVKLSDVEHVNLSDVKCVKLSDVKRVKLSDVKRVKLSDVKCVIPVSVKGSPLHKVGVSDRFQIHKVTSSLDNLPLREIHQVRTSSETPDITPSEIPNITSRKRPHETSPTAPGHDKPLELYIMRPNNTVLQDVFNNIARNIPTVKIDKKVDHI